MTRLGHRLEPVDVQALIAERPFEGFYVGVIRRRPRARKVDPDTVVIGPYIDKMSGELGAVIYK